MIFATIFPLFMLNGATKKAIKFHVGDESMLEHEIICGEFGSMANVIETIKRQMNQQKECKDDFYFKFKRIYRKVQVMKNLTISD